MRKFIVIILVALLTSCALPKVANVVSALPDGYTKAYHVTDSLKSTPDDMEKFVEDFTTDADFVICIDTFDYLILRK